MVLLAILGQALSFIYQLPFIVINFSVLLIGVIIGKLSDLVGQLRSDLIRRLRGEMEFWGSEERYQALDTAFTGVLIVDSEEKILYGNLTFADMLGQVPDNLLGVPLEIILESDQYSKFQEHQNLMKKGIASQFEIIMARKDGSVRTMLISSTPRFTVDGTYTGALCIITDITERKQLDDALRNIAAGVSATTGEEFFEKLVQYLVTALRVRYAFVSELIDGDITRTPPIFLY